MTSRLACASLLIATALSARASAEGSAADSERANVLFKKGKIAFNAAKYNDALRIYSEAWSLKKSPDIAANLAQTESELGKHRDAAEHFAFAIAHLLPSSTDEQKAALNEGLELEKKQIGSLRVTLEPADSTLTIDDEPVSVPSNGDVFVEPGEHRTVATHDGYEPNQQTLRISTGAAQVLWIRLQPVDSSNGAGGGPAAPPSVDAHQAASPVPAPIDGADPHPTADQRSWVPVFVGGGLFAAGTAVGIAFLISGNSSQRDADRAHSSLASDPNACGAGTIHVADCNTLHSKNSDVDHARALEFAGFTVAGAAAVGTAIYLLWPQSSSGTTAASQWHPTLALAPGATSVGVTGRF